ncbi:MAG: polysaccharide export protein [Alphaproteobacteria bacterium]|nr:polysaccharide export protein [Alphaproteobacteria bacterium]
MSLKRVSTLCFLSLLISSCGALPVAGPYSHDLRKDAAIEITGHRISKDLEINDNSTIMAKQMKYVVIDINEHTIDTIAKNRKAYGKKPANWPEKTKSHVTKVDVGDSISITIYEQNSGGLFVPKEAGVRPGNFITLPPQIVDSYGYITVPYAGSIKATGKTTAQIGEAITSALSELALAPQVVVSFSSRGGTEVSVLGAVRNASRFSLGFNNERILDVIAAAGGPTAPGYETWVSLQRDEKEYSVIMDNLLLEPSKNIFMHPNDTVYLYREAEVFNVYGAASNQGTLNFNKRSLSLSEALGRAQGLQDNRADPAEIYIYKEEPYAYIQAIKEDLSLGEEDKYAQFVASYVPVIYKLNLREHKGFFFAQKFPVSNQDTIYIANAESVEYLKFLDIVSNTSTTVENTDNTFN